MTSSSPDPDPSSTAGLTSGGGDLPGDTPPMAGSQSQAATRTGERPNQAPTKASRIPMVIALVFIALTTLSVIGYGVAEIYAYLSS